MLFKFLPFLTTFPPVITTHSFFTALTFRPFRALCKSAGHWAFSDEMLLSITSPEWIVKHRNVTNCVLGGDSCGDSTCCVRNLPLRAPPSADWSQLIYYWHPNWKKLSSNLQLCLWMWKSHENQHPLGVMSTRRAFGVLHFSFQGVAMAAVVSLNTEFSLRFRKHSVSDHWNINMSNVCLIYHSIYKVIQ